MPAGVRTVVHDSHVWLSRTMTWVYGQVTRLGPAWVSWVVANRTVNLSEFPWNRIFSLRDEHGFLRWLVEMTLVRAGITKVCPSIHRKVQEFHPDILHSHFGPTGWRNLGLAASVGARHVVSFYGYDVTMIPRHFRWKKRYGELFRDADLFLCEGPHMAETLIELGCSKAKVRLYHLGVNIEELTFREPSWQPDRPLNILMAATFREKKGFPYGIQAIGALLRRKPDLDVCLTIVGTADRSKASQQEANRIVGAIESEGLSSRVSFMGSLSHAALIGFAKTQDLFLSPSVTASNGDTEGGSPVAITEMMAMGLPIVSTTHCDIPHVVADRNRLLLAPERDVRALADSLQWLVENHEEWCGIAEENRTRVEQEFDITKQGPLLGEIYGKLMDGGKAGIGC